MIIVGIPSYNEGDNIGFVVEQIDKGLKKYFPHQESIIVNVDNNSPDKTREVFLKTKTSVTKLYITTPAGIKGKGHNLYNLFKLIKKHSSQINIVVDADLKSIKPDWIKKMAMSIIRGYDFATPVYSRNKKDGLITKNFCYPLIYGVLGWNISQPIGGDFAFSLKMNNHWVSKKWLAPVYDYGIDIFMTTEAILNNFKICQVDLGRKAHRASQRRLESMFMGIAEVLFEQLLKYKKSWSNQKIKEPKIFYPEPMKMPQPLKFELKTFKKTRTNPDLWSKIVYDFLSRYSPPSFSRQKRRGKKKLLKDLTKLAFNRFYSYIKSIEKLNFKQAEREVLKQAKIFRKNRNFLIE